MCGFPIQRGATFLAVTEVVSFNYNGAHYLQYIVDATFGLFISRFWEFCI